MSENPIEEIIQQRDDALDRVADLEAECDRLADENAHLLECHAPDEYLRLRNAHDAAEAEVKRLRAERDEARRVSTMWHDENHKAHREIDRLAAVVDGVRTLAIGPRCGNGETAEPNIAWERGFDMAATLRRDIALARFAGADPIGRPGVGRAIPGRAIPGRACKVVPEGKAAPHIGTGYAPDELLPAG